MLIKKYGGKKVPRLLVLSERIHKKVQQKTEMPVAFAMRYGKPSIEKGLQELADKGVTEVLLFRFIRSMPWHLHLPY